MASNNSQINRLFAFSTSSQRFFWFGIMNAYSLMTDLLFFLLPTYLFALAPLPALFSHSYQLPCVSVFTLYEKKTGLEFEVHYSASELSYSLYDITFLCSKGVYVSITFSFSFTVKLPFTQSHLPVTDSHQWCSATSVLSGTPRHSTHLYHNSPVCSTTFMPRNAIHSCALDAALLTFSSQRLTFPHIFDWQLPLFLDFEGLNDRGCVKKTKQKKQFEWKAKFKCTST